MSAPARKVTSAVIGCKGLDVLHMMRLKVASSLLMAEYIQADVQEWNHQDVDLLVVSIDDSSGQQVLRESGVKGVPVLTVTRKVLSGLHIPEMAHGASVREIFQQLRQLLQQSGDSGERFLPRTLFRSLADMRGNASLLHLGLVKLMVDAEQRQVTLMRDISYENCLKAAGESGWTLSLVAPGSDVDKCMADAIRKYPFEDFCWRAASLSDEPLLPQNMQGLAQLRGWPELRTGQLPVEWLLPMAALMIRPWRPEHLALVTGSSLNDLARIIAAAACTGLLDTSGNEVAATRSGNGNDKVPGFLSRIAKRFGLNFSKGLQG